MIIKERPKTMRSHELDGTKLEPFWQTILGCLLAAMAWAAALIIL